MKTVIPMLIFAALLSGCGTYFQDTPRSPTDQWQCYFKPDGKATSYPCIDNRLGEETTPGQWDKLIASDLPIVAHPTATETWDLCGDEYACKIDGVYHVTAGDVAGFLVMAIKL